MDRTWIAKIYFGPNLIKDKREESHTDRLETKV